MIKITFFVVLAFGTLVASQIQRVDSIINNELVLPSFSAVDTVNHIVIKLESNSGNGGNVPITVQLKEVSQINGVTTSTLITSQVCTLYFSDCIVVFSEPQLDSSKQYTVKLESATVLPKVEANAQISIETPTGTIYRSSKA